MQSIFWTHIRIYVISIASCTYWKCIFSNILRNNINNSIKNFNIILLFYLLIYENLIQKLNQNMSLDNFSNFSSKVSFNS